MCHMSTINLQKESSPFTFISNHLSDIQSLSFSPELPEVTLYYATVATDRLSERGNMIYNEYILTQQEASDSGLQCSIATWNNLNDLANGGHHYPDMIINTPQGKFIWTEIFEEDEYTGEIEMTDCMYRPYGAPVTFAETLEEYLFDNFGAVLLSVSDNNGNYNASIMNVHGELILI